MSDKHKKEARKTFSGRLKAYFFILVALIIFAVILFFMFFHKNPPAEPSLTCGDGSLYSTCSLTKPYYCSNGFLTNNASVCGCPENMTIEGNLCASVYQSRPKMESFTYILNGKRHNVTLQLYGGLSGYLSTLPNYINYSNGEQAKRSDFVLNRINNAQEAPYIDSLVKIIQNLAPNNSVDQARIAVSLVQNIPWGPSSKKVNFYGEIISYSRYPYQVLYDNQGLCGEKSELLTFILRDLGYGVALFYYPKENHETVGIKCPLDDSFNDTGYCFVETSGPAIISDSRLVYAGGITLKSNPQLIVISNGASLPEGLPEYTDAKLLTMLQGKAWIDPISSLMLKNIEKEYGLSEPYNIN